MCFLLAKRPTLLEKGHRFPLQLAVKLEGFLFLLLVDGEMSFIDLINLISGSLMFAVMVVKVVCFSQCVCVSSNAKLALNLPLFATVRRTCCL